MAVGRFYFAWASDDETFDPASHAREDLQVLAVDVSKEEGAFAVCSLEVVNPRAGLLAWGQVAQPDWQDSPSGPRAIVSVEPSPGSAPVVLFDGILTGFPRGASGETIEIELVGRPRDWDVRQIAFLDTLKVAPYWDSVLVSPTSHSDPAEVLAARSALLEWSRVGGGVSLSDILAGSRTLDLTGMHFYDSLDMSIGQPPVQAVALTLEVQWTQQASGVAKLGSRIERLFRDGKISTLTADDLMSRWPREGDSLGADTGYSVVKSSLVPTKSVWSASYAETSDPIAVPTTAYPSHDPQKDRTASRTVSYPRAWFDATLDVKATYEQARSEKMALTLTADIQSLAAGYAPTETLALRTQDVSRDTETPEWQASTTYLADSYVLWGYGRYQAKSTHQSGASFLDDWTAGRWREVATLGAPIGTLGAHTYLLTDRGQTTIKNAILRARARLAYAARCVKIGIVVAAEDALDVSTDDSVVVTDDRLPGGSAVGKVTRYRLVFDGSGARYCSLELACCIGNGNAVDGDSVVEDVPYSIDTTSVYVPVLCAPFNADALVEKITIRGQPHEQVAAAQGIASAGGDVDKAVADNPTAISFKLRSLASLPIITTQISVSAPSGWPAPKHIDLASAPANVERMATEDGDRVLLERGGIILID